MRCILSLIGFPIMAYLLSPGQNFSTRFNKVNYVSPQDQKKAGLFSAMSPF